MKKIILLVMLSVTTVYSQKAKPMRLMIMPSDNLLFKYGCISEFNNQGVSESIRDFKKLFRENTEVLTVISAINKKFTVVGFNTTMLDGELKKVESKIARNLANGTRTDQKTLIMNSIKNDIYLDLSYEVKKGGLGSQLTFNLNAIDSYSSEGIASIGSPGIPTTNTNISQMLSDQVEKNLDGFINDINQYFEGVRENGRSANLSIQLSENSDLNLKTAKCKGQKLTDLIQETIKENAFNKDFSRLEVGDSEIIYDVIKIPLFNSTGEALDISEWLNPLITKLENVCGYTVNNDSYGKGQGILIIE